MLIDVYKLFLKNRIIMTVGASPVQHVKNCFLPRATKIKTTVTTHNRSAKSTTAKAKRNPRNVPCYLHNFFLSFIKFDVYRSAPKSEKYENEKANITNVDGVIKKIDQLMATEREKCLVRKTILA